MIPDTHRCRPGPATPLPRRGTARRRNTAIVEITETARTSWLLVRGEPATNTRGTKYLS
jgi:hypothetical protein